MNNDRLSIGSMFFWTNGGVCSRVELLQSLKFTGKPVKNTNLPIIIGKIGKALIMINHVLPPFQKRRISFFLVQVENRIQS